jgi:hypothetical protein
MLSTISSIGYELLAVLGPSERLNAMRRFDYGGGIGSGSVLTNKWFVLMGASIVFILTIVFIALRRYNEEIISSPQGRDIHDNGCI